MRRQVDPLLEDLAALLDLANSLKAEGELAGAEMFDLTRRQRQVARAQSDLVLAALRNQYPHLDQEAVETLTPARISQVFNEILLLTTSGSNEPGETLPPPVPKKRH